MSIQFAAIGDFCVDVYPQHNKNFPGGTAFNVAINAASIGASASVFSAIGTDSKAGIFQKTLDSYKIDTTHLRIIEGETSSIQVRVDKDGKNSFSEWELGVLGDYTLSSDETKELKKYDIARAVLFQPMANLFEQFCSLDLPHTLKAADFAGTSDYSEKTDVIKKYIDKLDVIIKSLEEQDETALLFFQQLSLEHKDKIILVLLGKHGSIVFKNGKTYKQTVFKTNVKDTNGAGDAYIAAFLVNYVQTRDIVKSMQKGSREAYRALHQLGAVDLKPMV